MKTNMLPRCFAFQGYETVGYDVSTRDRTLKVRLKPLPDKPLTCHICSTLMKKVIHTKPRKAKDLGVRNFTSTVHFPRRTGFCHSCNKGRVEEVEFLSDLTPHYTRDYAWWLGEMCEIATTKNAARFSGVDNMTLRRIDLRRMKKLLTGYAIPLPERISVDEVYAYKKNRFDPPESRNEKFFTVISDLDTRKVIWVGDSRNRTALDQFYMLIGKDACNAIKVVAMDQHEDYRVSTREHCPNALVVWDRFHIMKNFNEALNDTRKQLHSQMTKDDPKLKLTRGKYRYLFLKKAENRSKREQRHIDDVLLDHHEFAQLEMIKENMLVLFDQPDEKSAKEVFSEIGNWIWQKGFKPLMRWYRSLEKQWATFSNYFQSKVTSALSEGVNNVIKALKRQAFGFTNMEYFKLKIMQRCGYLNSKYIESPI